MKAADSNRGSRLDARDGAHEMGMHSLYSSNQAFDPGFIGDGMEEMKVNEQSRQKKAPQPSLDPSALGFINDGESLGEPIEVNERGSLKIIISSPGNYAQQHINYNRTRENEAGYDGDEGDQSGLQDQEENDNGRHAHVNPFSKQAAGKNRSPNRISPLNNGAGVSVKGANNSIFHQRGQPRFSSGSEGEEDVVGGKISHRTAEGEDKSEAKDSFSIGGPTNLKPSRNNRVSPGMRGSLPRMSIDGENYSKQPNNDTMEDEEADYANGQFKSSYLKNERMNSGESQDPIPWQMSIVQRPSNTNQVYSPAHAYNSRSIKKKQSQLRNPIVSNMHILEGGSENLVTLDFYQNNNSLNREDLLQQQYLETERDLEIKRVTPEGYRGGSGRKRVQKKSSEGVNLQDSEDDQVERGRDEELCIGINDNPLYESRDYGVKLHIDTLSVNAPIVVEPIDDFKNDTSILREEGTLQRQSIMQPTYIEQDSAEERELDQELLDHQEPYFEEGEEEVVNPFATDNEKILRDAFAMAAQRLETEHFGNFLSNYHSTEEGRLFTNPGEGQREEADFRFRVDNNDPAWKELRLENNLHSQRSLGPQELAELTNRFDVDLKSKPAMDKKRAERLLGNGFLLQKIEDEIKKDSSFFLVVEKTPLEKIEDISGPFSRLRKLFCKVRINVSSIALVVISSKTFEAISMIVILLNSISLAIEDPTETEQSPMQETLDEVFLALYSLEMILKILALGFILSPNAYLRDTWNLIDFAVVMSGYLQLMIQNTGVSLAGLRVLRVLRPLRSIQKITGLKLIVQALLSSLPLLRDTLVVLFFFFFIFAIAGLQLFGGALKNRCISEETGVRHPDDKFCGVDICPPSYFCGETLSSMNFDQTNFDTIFFSLIAIFTSVTLEGWTSVMAATAQSYTQLSFLFFIPLVFIGAFFLLNLTLAVIKAKFSDEHAEKGRQNEENQLREHNLQLGNKKKFNLHIEERNFDDLNNEQKVDLIAKQKEVRDTVLKKWRGIMFIKTHIKDYMRRFRAKKQLRLMLQERETQGGMVTTEGNTPGGKQFRPITAIESQRPQERQGSRRKDSTPEASLTRKSLHFQTPYQIDGQAIAEDENENIEFTKVEAPNQVDRFSDDEDAVEIEDHHKVSSGQKKAKLKLDGLHGLDPNSNFGDDAKTEKAISIEGTPKNKNVKMPKTFVVEDFRDSQEGFNKIRNNLDDDIEVIDQKLRLDIKEPLSTPQKHHLNDNNFFNEEGKQQTPSPSKGLSKFNIKPLPLEQLGNNSNNNTVFNSPKGKGFDKMSTNAKNLTFYQTSEMKNKIVPFTSEMEMQLTSSPMMNESPYKNEHIPVEKSVLNSRFLVQQEILSSQKIYVRKDKIHFLSLNDVFEERKKKIQQEKQPIELPGGFESGSFGGLFANWGIMPWQRRQILTPRVYAPDDEQIECLALLEMEPNELELTIQHKYDESYVSDFYATSSISICLNMLSKESWIEKRIRVREQELGKMDKEGARKFLRQRTVAINKKLKSVPPPRTVTEGGFIGTHNKADSPQLSDRDTFNKQGSQRNLLGSLNRESIARAAQTQKLQDVAKVHSLANTTKLKPSLKRTKAAGEINVAGIQRTLTLNQQSMQTEIEAVLEGEKFRKEIHHHLYLKNQLEPLMSISQKLYATAGSDITQLLERKRAQLMQTSKRTSNAGDENQEKDKEAMRRQLFLKKRAEKDAQLQMKLIITQLNKGVFQSRLFKQKVIHRRTHMSEEDQQNKHIMTLYDVFTDEELAKIAGLEDEAGNEEESEDDGFESSDSDEDEDGKAIRDDFLDMPLNFVEEANKAVREAKGVAKICQNWSGQEVLLDFEPAYAKEACQRISSVRVWPKSGRGLWKRARVLAKAIVTSDAFDSFLTFCVFINTLCLALDHYDQTDLEEQVLGTFNSVFTWIFIAELSLKLHGLGPIRYLKDRMNYLDGMVVVVSIAEMIITQKTSQSGAHQAFRSVRIFRIFRVLRVARLLRAFQSMQVIMQVLVRSMNSFIYLAMLLLLFLFIFTLLGMQIFGGMLDFEENFDGTTGVPLTNFNNFHSAFLTTFQVLTMESWPLLLYDGLRAPGVNRVISAIYFISWVFMGNFILLNLFLAILLDSFTDESTYKSLEESDAKQHQKMLRSLSGAALLTYYQELDHKGLAKGSGVKGLGSKKKKTTAKKKPEQLLDESFEYDQASLTKKMELVKSVKIDFDGIHCEKSFFLFKKTDCFRRTLYRMVTSTKFEGVVLVLIIMSSLKLVIDTYLADYPEGDPLIVISDDFDSFFTAAFAIESVMKAIAFGIFIDHGSYLRETWNQLDALIVFVSIVDASFENINLPVIKILRLLRTLRPLRFISHNSGMKTIVVALVQSIGGIFNVAIVVMIVWMMFAILAVNLFGGKLHYCSVEQYFNHNEEQCLKNRGQWMNQAFNYDSVPQAMLTLFSLATLENWPAYMYNVVNSQGEKLGPKINASPAYAYFFVVFVLIGSFLFLNLFVGVIFKEFEDAQKEEKASLMLKDHQLKWVDMMKMIVKATPDLETTNRPKSGIRLKLHNIVTWWGKPLNHFDNFIMICIITNMLLMSCHFDDAPLYYVKSLENANYFFTIVFFIEFLFKIVAFGMSYFQMGWNVFDFSVVCASLFEILLDQMGAGLKFLRMGPQIAKILRVTRVSRLIRLINRYKGLSALLQTIWFSLPSLFNVFALLMLIYFIFAVLGTFLFRKITHGDVINESFNFSNFGMALLVVIRMSTGEDWNFIMQDTMRTPEDGCIPNQTCGLSYAPVFFIPLMMLCTFIMLNLFVLVIIQQFEMYYLDEDNVITRFKEDLERFKATWTHFTKDHNCLKIKDTRLVAFMGQMDAPLGMRGNQLNEIIKSVMAMELQSDNEGFVYFNELLFRAMRRVYGDEHVLNKILVEQEIQTMKKIEAIKEKMIKRSRVQERLKAAQVNPFTLQLYMTASFKAWLKMHRHNAPRRREEEALGMNKIKNMPSLEEDDGEQVKREIKRGTPLGGGQAGVKDFKRLQSEFGCSAFNESQHDYMDDSLDEDLEYQTIEDVELNSEEEDSMQEAYFEGERENDYQPAEKNMAKPVHLTLVSLHSSLEELKHHEHLKQVRALPEYNAHDEQRDSELIVEEAHNMEKAENLLVEKELNRLQLQTEAGGSLVFQYNQNINTKDMAQRDSETLGEHDQQ